MQSYNVKTGFVYFQQSDFKYLSKIFMADKSDFQCIFAQFEREWRGAIGYDKGNTWNCTELNSLNYVAWYWKDKLRSITGPVELLAINYTIATQKPNTHQFALDTV